MERLLHSAKFWTAVLDALISLALFFVGKYAPSFAEDVKILTITLQPVFVVLIAAIAYEDGQTATAAARVKEAELFAHRDTEPEPEAA